MTRPILSMSLGVIVGCGSAAADLEPADPSAAMSYLEDAARDDDGPVTLIVKAVDWPGRSVADDVTPLYVDVRNDGDVPLAIDYQDFVLVGRSGRAYPPLPPMRVAGELELDPETRGDSYERFVLDDAQDRTQGRWRVGGPLPSASMMIAALPQGVLLPRGFVSGWLYFEKVDAGEEVVTLRADLASPKDEPVAALTIVLEDG